MFLSASHTFDDYAIIIWFPAIGQLALHVEACTSIVADIDVIDCLEFQEITFNFGESRRLFPPIFCLDQTEVISVVHYNGDSDDFLQVSLTVG